MELGRQPVASLLGGGPGGDEDRLHLTLLLALRVVAVELLCAAQGIDLRRPLTTSPALAEALAEVRAVAPFFENDRQVAPDIEAVAARIGAGAFDKLAGVSVEGG